MKRILYLFILIIITLFLQGCVNSKQKLLSSDSMEEEIHYNLEQVLLSKGFQSIEPKVEILKKGSHVKLLASLGLVESSGVYINKITRKGNEVNIYVHNQIDNNNLKIAVPQIIFDIKGSKLKNLENIKFNIINENYKPLSIKLGVNDVINKINSAFKVTTHTTPTLDLANIDNNLFWNITYNSILDRSNLETPLINLSVQINANSGEIVKSTKSFLSSLIDEGQILDYVPDSYLLYKKSGIDLDKGVNVESLWYFDIKNNTKTMLFSSKFNIFSASFSPDIKYVSLIEVNSDSSELYVIPVEDKRAYKVSFEKPTTPKIIKWQDNNNLYIVENNNENSKIFKYNILENEVTHLSDIDKNIVSLRIARDSFLIVEGDDHKINLRIYITKDWKDLKLKDFGFSPYFIDENKIAYLKNDEKEDKNYLIIEDALSKKQYDSIDINVANYTILSQDKILIVEKTQHQYDFNLLEYDINTKAITTLANIKSDRVFYNKEKNLLYGNLIVPFESEKQEIIYSVELSKLTNLEP